MLTVAVQELADMRLVFGTHSMSCGTDRVVTDEIGAAAGSHRTTNHGERTCDHELTTVTNVSVDGVGSSRPAAFSRSK